MATKKKTSTKAKQPRSREPKQKKFPDVDMKIDKELSDAAQNLYEVRTERMEWTEKEDQAAQLLAGVMRKKDVVIYIDPDRELRVTLKPAKAGKDKVRVERIDEEQKDAAE